MVKQLQKKFIISAMLAVTILLVVLIGGINVFNYLTTSGDTTGLWRCSATALKPQQSGTQIQPTILSPRRA